MNGSDVSLATFAGDVDVQMRDALREALAILPNAPRAIVDLSNVRYIDSAAVTELLLAHQARVARGGDPIRLVVTGGSNVARLVELAGLDQVFAVVASLDEARHA